MSNCHQAIAVCAALVTWLASHAALAAPLDWAGCTVPVFGADKHLTITACDSILARPDLSEADRERALIIAGRAAHMSDDIDEAIRDFDEAIKLSPKDPEPLIRRASIAFYKHDYRTAAALAEKALSLDANYAPAFDILGTIGLANKNFAQAKTAYDKEIELTPNDVLARFHHFEYLMDIDAQPEALQELDKLLALSPSDLDAQFTRFRGKEISYHTLARLERATMLESMGRFSEAIDAFDDFVRLDPGAFSYGWRGWYQFDRSEFDLAKADLEKALSYAPDFWILHNLLGRVYLYTKEYERAVDSLTRSLALRPTYSSSAYWSRALALRALHRTDEAEVDALKAVTSDDGFLRKKLLTLNKLGYFQPPNTAADFMPAVRDAVRACMLDERCW